MEIEDDLITLLATDRYRLAMRELPGALPPRVFPPAHWSRPRRSTKWPRPSATAATSTLPWPMTTAGLSASRAAAAPPRRSWSTATIRRSARLFPDSTPIHATVQTQELVEAVRRVSLVAERNTPVRLAFTAGPAAPGRRHRRGCAGLRRTRSPADRRRHHRRLQPALPVEGLSVIETKFVRFSFTTAPKPAMITAQHDADGEDQDDYRYLVMPVRLPN